MSISCAARRQWAAVRTTRGERTTPEQNPALSPPRFNTMTISLAKRAPFSAAPTTAPAGEIEARPAATHSQAINRAARLIAFMPLASLLTRERASAPPVGLGDDGRLYSFAIQARGKRLRHDAKVDIRPRRRLRPCPRCARRRHR